GEQWDQSRDLEQGRREGRALENPLRTVAKGRCCAKDLRRCGGSAGNEDVFGTASFELRNLGGEVSGGGRERGLRDIFQGIMADGLFVASETVVAVVVVLVDDTRAWRFDFELVDHVIEGVLDLQAIGRTYQDEIFFTRQIR